MRSPVRPSRSLNAPKEELIAGFSPRGGFRLLLVPMGMRPTRTAFETPQTAASSPQSLFASPRLHFRDVQPGPHPQNSWIRRSPYLVVPVAIPVLPHFPKANARTALLSCRVAAAAASPEAARAPPNASTSCAPRSNPRTDACAPRDCAIPRAFAAPAIATRKESPLPAA